jgi:hypothetical protein
MQHFEAHERDLQRLRQEHQAELAHEHIRTRAAERDAADSREDTAKVCKALDAELSSADAMKQQVADLLQQLECGRATERALKVRIWNLSACSYTNTASSFSVGHGFGHRHLRVVFSVSVFSSKKALVS